MDFVSTAFKGINIRKSMKLMARHMLLNAVLILTPIVHST